MKLNEYQKQAKKTAIFEKDVALNYLTMGLCSEAGEVADKIAKSYRDRLHYSYQEVAKELGDVLWFVALMADYHNFTLEEIAQGNLDKLASRMERNAITGSGDNR